MIELADLSDNDRRVNTINGRLYSEDPTILAWNLINEPRCFRCGNGLLVASSQLPISFLCRPEWSAYTGLVRQVIAS